MKNEIGQCAFMAIVSWVASLICAAVASAIEKGPLDWFFELTSVGAFILAVIMTVISIATWLDSHE